MKKQLFIGLLMTIVAINSVSAAKVAKIAKVAKADYKSILSGAYPSTLEGSLMCNLRNMERQLGEMANTLSAIRRSKIINNFPSAVQCKVDSLSSHVKALSKRSTKNRKMKKSSKKSTKSSNKAPNKAKNKTTKHKSKKRKTNKK
jgi:hypothetical protein